MRHILVLLLPVLLSPLQDYRDAKKQFEQAVVALDLEAVRRLAKRLGEIDTGPAAGTLVDGIDAVGRRIEELWAQRGALEAKESTFRNLEEETRRYNAQIAQLQKDNKPVPEGLRTQGDRLRARHAEWGKTREELTATEERILLAGKARDAIADGLAAVKSDAAVRDTAKALRGAKAWTTRACAAQALARIDHAEALPALLSRLEGRAESDIGALVAVVDAIWVKAQWGSETLGALAAMLEHKAWQVRSATARALRASKSLAAVEPLLKAFEASDGRLRDELHMALVGVTGIDKGFDPAGWRTWFDQHQAAIADGSWKPREDERVDGEGRAIGTGVTFFGIPVRSKSIVFVLDRSGSMAEPGGYDEEEERYIETGGTGKLPKELKDLKPAGTRKIDIAKYQLKKVLLTLPAGTRFNIVFYNHRFTVMSDRMVALSGSARSKAFAFFEPLEPEGETDIWQSLGEAMKFCARAGPDGQALEESADTIYLLSDGLPFPPGKVVGPNEIMARFGAWNRARRVVVHTVFVSAMNSGDYSEGHDFMRKFAEENGGSFKAPKQPNQ
jgi:hypothetical protein